MSRTMPLGSSKGPQKSKSEDLSKTMKSDEMEDEYGGYGQDDDGEEEREKFRQQASSNYAWKDGGKEKDNVLQTLIQQFGMIIQKNFKEDQYDDEGNPIEGQYTKLPSAKKAIMRISEALRKNENWETRDFTLFIAKKGWVEKILLPLIEVSYIDDRDLVDRGCRLLMTLIRTLRENTRKNLGFDPIRAKATGQDPESIAIGLRAKANAIEQVSALLSFKEALCTERCAVALVTFFGRAWESEILKEVGSENTKQDMAVVFSFVRRLLAIEADARHSSPGEIEKERSNHQKLVVHLRSLLFVLPGMLGDLLRKDKSGERYHDSHINDLLRIVRHALRGHCPRDLYIVWREGGLLTEADSISQSIEDNSLSAMPVVVPVAIQQRQANATKGLLRNQLASQRSQRQAAVGPIDSRNGRFGGLFVKPLQQGSAASAAAASAATQNQENKDKDDDPALLLPPAHSKAKAIVKRGVFLNNASYVPQPKARRSKRMITFASGGHGDAGDSNNPFTNALSTRDGQESCVVVASLVDMICTEKALNTIILRVNEDARRDEGIIRDDMELVYFEILAVHLQYNRLKLNDSKLKFMQEQEKLMGANSAIAASGDSEPAGWQPDITNLANALDSMTQNRVLFSIEYLFKKKLYLDIIKPLEVYKEIVCYLRVLLESSNPGHHDISVAYLYRLFYASSERKDPLPRLLGEWKPHTYTRTHLNTLVELAHETLKTLEAAKRHYGSESADDEKSRRKRARVKGNNDLEQYVSGALRFNVEEYFKRLVTNPTIRIFTKLLDKYATNAPNINYYATAFLQRMCAFKLEQEYPAPAPGRPDNSTDGLSMTPPPDADLSLMFMLFNVPTLATFSLILSDPNVATQQHMAALLRLIKQVVRRFGEAAAKNRLLFCEALFRQPHPHLFCVKLDNVYEAQAYRMGLDDRRDRYDDGYSSSGSDRSRVDEDRPKAVYRGAASDDDGEFDENDIKAVTAEQVRRAAKEKKRAEREMSGLTSRARKDKSKKGSKRTWTPQEDAVLRELFNKYKGSHSVFFSIAEDEDMRAFEKNRSVDAISRRVKELQLHMAGSDSDDDDDVPSVRPTIRRGKGIPTSDDELEFDDDQTQPQEQTSAADSNRSAKSQKSVDLDALYRGTPGRDYDAEGMEDIESLAKIKGKKRLSEGATDDDDDDDSPVQKKSKSTKVKSKKLMKHSRNRDSSASPMADSDMDQDTEQWATGADGPSSVLPKVAGRRMVIADSDGEE